MNQEHLSGTPATDTGRAPRCSACGALLPEGYHKRKLCPECRAPIRLAADPQARGPQGWCTRHPQEPTTGICSSCGRFTCVRCDITVRGIRYCADCREHLAARLAAPVAWEERRSIGRISAWTRTTLEITSRPGSFFERMEPRADLSSALLYGLSASTLQWLWQTLLLGLYFVMLAGMGLIIAIAGAASGSGSGGPAAGLVMFGVAAAILLFAALTPVFNLLGILVLASIQHLCLRIVGAGGEHGLGATLKVACYALAPGWTGIIPYFGQMAVPIWWAILMVVGTAKVHNCSVTRALVTLVPFLLMFLSPIIAYAGFVVVAIVAEYL